MTKPDLNLEQQLERSIQQVQQRKRTDLDEWLDAAPVPPKRLTKEEGMSKNAIVKGQQQGIELGRVPTEWEVMRSQAEELLKSGFLPKSIKSPEQAIAIMQTGKELGLGPMQSLRGIHVIDGKPAMSADLIAGLALARVPGSTLRVVESTNDVCRVEAARADHAATPFSFSMSDARAAGLTGKDVWRKYPRAMLRARCLTEACRAVFPDVVMGLYSPEELEDSTSGQVIDVQPYREGREGTLSLSPHSDSPDAAPVKVDPVVYQRAMTFFAECDKAIFDPGCTWETMNKWRSLLGRRGEPTELGKSFSDLYRGDMSEEDRKALAAAWQRVDRKLTQLEGRLKPPPVEASFTDEPDEEATGVFSPSEDPAQEELL